MTALQQMDEYASYLREAGTTYMRKKWYNYMVELYEKYAIVRNTWEHIENAHLIVSRFIKKAKKRIVRTIYNIDVSESADLYSKGNQQFYLIRLLNGNNLVWSKIGTTTRPTLERMREHLRDYKKYGIDYLIVDRVWNCGELPAEGIESMFRGFYIKKYPGTWKKNDRFCGVEFDLEEAERKFEEFIS